MTFTRWQRLVAENYAEGDYSHTNELDECRDVGDGLFTFLMVELDPKEGCDDWPEALRRIEAARKELAALYNTINMHAPYITERGRQRYQKLGL